MKIVIVLVALIAHVFWVDLRETLCQPGAISGQVQLMGGWDSPAQRCLQPPALCWNLTVLLEVSVSRQETA